ncbi:MAG: thiamine pyrophosphate-dependent enzyme [Ignavibacteriales bacterium]|nr:thiamine pyrophosphate-dependent enzyme [Ignavibacteriales bacterium]
MLQLQLTPSDIALVTDIGCIGLADMMFVPVHTVHTTHGRSTAFATGIQIADAVLAQSALKTIVLIGDGGAMIGLQHLVNAALLNVDVTVLLCNNFLFGMTGGQNSAFSPNDFITPTTPNGNIIPPIDMCRMMEASGAEFSVRALATQKGLSDTIARAIMHPGFSLVEIVELCTEHATERNDLSGSKLAQVIESQGQRLGDIVIRQTRKSFGTMYAAKNPRKPVPPSLTEKTIVPSFQSTLNEQVGIVLAGSAGERVQSSAKKLCDAAIVSGVYCTQKNDNPVTQGSGFSLSEVILSNEEIFYTAIDVADVAIVVSQDGLTEVKENGLLERMTSSSLLMLDANLAVPETVAMVEQYPYRKEFGGDKAALAAVKAYVRKTGILPEGAL